MKRILLLGFSLFIFIIASSWNSIFAQNTSQTDFMLQLLDTELQHNMEFLSKQNTRVYLLSYRVEESQQYLLESTFGNLDKADFTQTRYLTISVRVGDRFFDNYHSINQDFNTYSDLSVCIELPIENGYEAIVQTLRCETENAYREALIRFEKVKSAQLLTANQGDKISDFSLATSEHYYELPLSDSPFDWKTWKQKIRSFSLNFKPCPEILKGSATLQYKIVRKYFVSSEGSSIVQNNTYSYLSLNVIGKADDGMDLPLSKQWFGFMPEDLPNDNEVLNESVALKDLLLVMRVAPIADAYSGPVLLSAEVAGVFFHEILGHRVEGTRMKNSHDGQTLKDKIGQSLLPSDFTIFFDPSIKYYDNKPLSGSYIFDDEGVRGDRVQVINHGILENFLMSRTPIDGFPTSNGHARAQSGKYPIARQSNLIVQTQSLLSSEQLRQQLIAEARKQNKPFGYYVKKIEGGFAQTYRNQSNIFSIKPTVVYRVYVDGREDELVRGIDFVGTPLSVISKISAAGGKINCYSAMCGAESGYISTTCCSPELLITQMETQKKLSTMELPPILERPFQDIENNDAEEFDNLAFRAMNEEIKRNMVSLNVAGLVRPYQFNYLVADAVLYGAKACLGSMIYVYEEPYRSQQTEVLVGEKTFNNQNFYDPSHRNFYCRWSLPISLDNNYNSVRNSLWQSSDRKYREAVELFQSKKFAMEYENLPHSLATLKDNANIDVQHYTPIDNRSDLSLSVLENAARELSKVFLDYPDFVSSGAEAHAYKADALYLSSEGMQYKQPFNIICIKAFASITAQDGQLLSDYETFYFSSANEIYSLDVMKEKVQNMAKRLEETRKSNPITENYCGPVLFLDDAVADLFGQLFVEESDGLIAGREALTPNSVLYRNASSSWLKENYYEHFIGKKIISPQLNIQTMDYLTNYQGISLIGHYSIDAEGVIPETLLSVVEKGVLKNLLSNRIQTPSSKASNGHQRLALSNNNLITTLSAGILSMSSRHSVSMEKIKKQLLTLAKEENYDYAYIVLKLADPMIDLPGMSYYFTTQGFRIPISIYRVSVKDGQMIPVRGAQIAPLSVKSFKNVVSVSSDRMAHNRMMRGRSDKNMFYQSRFPLYGAPTSFILPKAILMKDIEILIHSEMGKRSRLLNFLPKHDK